MSSRACAWLTNRIDLRKNRPSPDVDEEFQRADTDDLVDGEGSRPDYHPPSAACPTVGANCRGIAWQMLLGVAYVEGARRRRRIRERDWHTMYPGSRPLGAGSLCPPINPVYDHRLVYKGASVGRRETRSNLMWTASPVGVPLVALYMQPLRVYKGFGGLRIEVIVLGLQSAQLVWVQHAPVAVLGKSTHSGLGFSRLDPAGES